MEPFAAGAAGVLDRQPDKFSAEALPPKVGSDSGIQKKRVHRTIRDHVDKTDQPLTVVGSGPPQAPRTDTLPPPASLLAEGGPDEIVDTPRLDRSSPAVLDGAGRLGFIHSEILADQSSPGPVTGPGLVGSPEARPRRHETATMAIATGMP